MLAARNNLLKMAMLYSSVLSPNEEKPEHYIWLLFHLFLNQSVWWKYVVFMQQFRASTRQDATKNDEWKQERENLENSMLIFGWSWKDSTRFQMRADRRGISRCCSKACSSLPIHIFHGSCFSEIQWSSYNIHILKWATLAYWVLHIIPHFHTFLYAQHCLFCYLLHWCPIDARMQTKCVLLHAKNGLFLPIPAVSNVNRPSTSVRASSARTDSRTARENLLCLLFIYLSWIQLAISLWPVLYVAKWSESASLWFTVHT